MENRERRYHSAELEKNEVAEQPDNLEKANIEVRDREWLLSHVAEIVADPVRYIDKGGAGAVYEFTKDGVGRCVKVLEDRQKSVAAHLMDIGNNVRLEANIQMKLSGIEVAGVRAPEVYSYVKAEKNDAQKDLIIMERLDAICLQKILNSDESFPENFDPEIFTDALGEYLDYIHETVGVVHADLAPRNVMVDRKTGLPRLIDFGRSGVKSQFTDEDFQKAVDQEDLDFDAIAVAIFNLTDNE